MAVCQTIFIIQNKYQKNAFIHEIGIDELTFTLNKEFHLLSFIFVIIFLNLYSFK